LQHDGIMNNLVPFGIITGVNAVMIAVAIRSGLVRKRRMIANLQKLAAQLGLEFVAAEGWKGRSRVTGTLRGKKVEIFSYATSTGKSSTEWSVVTAQAAKAGALTFTLEKRSVVTKIEKLFGVHPVTMGDAEFDQACFVQTDQPDFLRAALIPELREKLVVALHACATGKFELKGNEVKYAEVGGLYDVKRCDRFAALADLVCDLADVAEVAAEGSGKT
jgi:hypothetical protein